MGVCRCTTDDSKNCDPGDVDELAALFIELDEAVHNPNYPRKWCLSSLEAIREGVSDFVMVLTSASSTQSKERSLGSRLVFLCTGPWVLCAVLREATLDQPNVIRIHYLALPVEFLQPSDVEFSSEKLDLTDGSFSKARFSDEYCRSPNKMAQRKYQDMVLDLLMSTDTDIIVTNNAVSKRHAELFAHDALRSRLIQPETNTFLMDMKEKLFCRFRTIQEGRDEDPLVALCGAFSDLRIRPVVSEVQVASDSSAFINPTEKAKKIGVWSMGTGPANQAGLVVKKLLSGLDFSTEMASDRNLTFQDVKEQFICWCIYIHTKRF